MKMRNTYGLNCQTVNFGTFADLVPLGYFEVAPGESFQGLVNSRLTSDQAINLILNRAYYDTFAFYIPFRLMWDGWPDFISNEVTSGYPLVTDLMPRNYENAFTQTAVAMAFTENSAWQRYAYNMVWNEYFRAQDIAEVALTDNTIKKAYLRESTLYAAARAAADVAETSIDTSGGSFTTRTLRAAMAADRFDRIRDFYGAKYTDYLAAVGVQSVWTILEQPEVIAMNHTDLRFTSTKATDGANLAEVGGLYDGVSKLSFKPKFLPEHGLIGFYGVPRMDVFNLSMGGLPILSKGAFTSRYWSPAYEQSDMINWPQVLLGDGNADTDVFYTPIHEEYRKAEHLIPNLAITAANSYVVSRDDATADPESYRSNSNTNLDAFFAGNLTIGAAQYHYQVTNEFKVTKKSPIARAMRSTVK